MIPRLDHKKKVKAAATVPKPPTTMFTEFVEPALPELDGEAAVVPVAPETLVELDEDRLSVEAEAKALGWDVVADAVEVVFAPSAPLESVPDMKVTADVGNELVTIATP
jgi:hypothetical protein